MKSFDKIISFILFLTIVLCFSTELNAQHVEREKRASFANSINSPVKEFNSNETKSNITGLFIGRIIGSIIIKKNVKFFL